MENLALELNTILDGTIAGRLLSNLGRRIFFPQGIIAQSSEAKKSARRANATIGMAFDGGKPLILSAVAESMSGLRPEETVVYAPTAGIEPVRRMWKETMILKNPSLKAGGISLPAVVPGITAGISYTADLFLDEGRPMLVCVPCWDNYSLIFKERRGAALREIPIFGSGPGLDMTAIEKAVREAAKTGAVRIIFNFPNNPSGYSPTRDEADRLERIVLEAAEEGADVLAICDDAYFGLFYEEETEKESLFGRFAALHDRVLAVKIDGPTKEDYVWGFRTGFLTFGSRGMEAASYQALEKKLLGIIRSSVSCANTAAQSITVKTLADPRSAGEKDRYRALLKNRYLAVKRFIALNPAHPALIPLPFNSGYFMSFLCSGIHAETLRQELLHRHGIGAIALGDRILRIAFSSLEEDQIPGVYRLIYDTAGELLPLASSQ
ncbi:MAG: aminotransferase class I/II-fold pyridoxal phosphate-dependent enzyme [Spirochaetaceae bacterium]|jgi:aspartate/methionine/tyrosine aminotransferase|nr:aminotransferase class I/II-fold pyridoxal phosphate-dependent enzyme [Spirochaetaceae bacterium]